MRKLVVLMLVLGMASLASAGMISIVGPAGETSLVLAPGAIVAGMQVVYAGSDLQGADVIIGADALNGVISDVVVVATNRASGLNYLEVATNSAGQPGYEFVAANDADNTFVGSPLATFTLAYVGGDFVLSPEVFDNVLYGGGLYQPIPFTVGGLQITEMIVPEPATMAILGLGGLLLRRKK